MANPPSRQLKICGLRRSSRGTTVPHLKIAGVWVEQLGFQIGERVNITTRLLKQEVGWGLRGIGASLDWKRWGCITQRRSHPWLMLLDSIKLARYSYSSK